MQKEIDISDVLTNIVLGKFDGDLDRIITAANSRRKTVGEAKIYSFSVGDRVKYNQLTKPKYLVGAIGTIKQINRTKVVVDLDSPAGKFSKNVITPTSLIEKA